MVVQVEVRACKVDTTNLYVSTFTVGSAQCSGCEVYGSSAMAAINCYY